MASYGYIALILFFSIAFGLNIAADIGSENPSTSSDIETYRNATQYQGGENVMTDVLGEFLSPELLGTTAIVAIPTLVITGNADIAIAAGSVAYLSVYLLKPLDIIAAAGIPYPFDWLLLGFMSLLMLSAIFSFVRGRDF